LRNLQLVRARLKMSLLLATKSSISYEPGSVGGGSSV
jgi:hypothetical protein